MYMDLEQSMPVRDSSSMIDQHREYYSRLGSFEEKVVPGQALYENYRWEVAQGCGEGFSELLRLNSGPNVGLCGYKFINPVEGSYREYNSSFKFSIMLTGNFKMSSLHDGRTETVHSGDIWFSAGGSEDEVCCVQPAEEFISGVGVEVSRGMLDYWLGGTACELSQSLERMLESRFKQREHVVCGAFPRMRSTPGNHPLSQSAHRLFMTERNTIYGRLMFESRALDFLSQALMLEAPLTRHTLDNRSQRQKAVEEAVSILDEEWGVPPTITSLARRVGVNECYLKTDFRERTGLSIGAYVRKIRMEKALALIESSRCSVLQAATFVGYSNPSHFSRAFKRFHGYLPSACLGRS